MQPDKARKEAMMEELKHYINGKFAELEEKLMPKKEEKPQKAVREKATKG
jgi:hypothetical protein